MLKQTLGDAHRLPSPVELGLPEQFAEWRDGQSDAIEAGLNSKRRTVAQMCPTGFGKSASNLAQAILCGGRAIYLTSTKGLQDQLFQDAAGIGLVDIRGKSSYRCACYRDLTCDEGGVANCPNKNSNQCPHARAVFKARSARYVVSNYSCWIAAHKYGQGFGEFDLMICDEAHSLPEELAKAMQIQLSSNQIEGLLGLKWPKTSRYSMTTWKGWAEVARVSAELRRDALASNLEKAKKSKSSDIRLLSQLNNLAHMLSDLAGCTPQHWVVDDWDYGFQFDPINPAEYGERVLFRNIPKLLLTSATIRPKTCDLVGLKAESVDFQEYPTSFLPTRSPIIYLPTAKMTYGMSDEDREAIVRRVDEIVDGRLDRKGTIHTVSFALRDYLMENSEFAPLMISNYSKQGDITGEVIQRYKAMDAPTVLVSPSISTGYDFPGDDCRYQIILKVPFPPRNSRAMAAREAVEPHVGIYKAVQDLVQAAGRGMRSKHDWQEVFILDANFGWVYWKHEKFFPAWFRGFFRPSRQVPEAPTRERMKW